MKHTIIFSSLFLISSCVKPVALDHTVLEDTKLSWETPKPKAPPSDFCKSIIATKRIAKIIFKIKIIFSMVVIYSNWLLYQ